MDLFCERGRYLEACSNRNGKVPNMKDYGLVHAMQLGEDQELNILIIVAKMDRSHTRYWWLENSTYVQ